MIPEHHSIFDVVILYFCKQMRPLVGAPMLAFLLAFPLAFVGTGCALNPVTAEVCGPLAAPTREDAQRKGQSVADNRRDFSQLPHGIRAIDCEAALCWAIPLDDTLAIDAPLSGQEVVLIDTGIDPAGKRLRLALGGAKVMAVWVTHGHIDHWAAAHLFIDDDKRPVPVFVPREDLPYMRLRKQHRSIFATLGQRLLPLPPLPKNLKLYDGDDVLRVEGRKHSVSARALHLPGHTPGSSAFLYRNTLFSGDSLVAPQVGGVCAVPGFLVTDDETQAWRSLRKLRGVDFEVLLDGNYGRTDGAASLVQPAIMRWRAQTRQ